MGRPNAGHLPISLLPFSRKCNIISHALGKVIRGGDLMKEKEKIITDPFGSYTGLVKHPDEKPVQDADDL